MRRAVPDAEGVDAYIAAQPANVQVLLRTMRAAIRRAAPHAIERISYRIPTFTGRGNLVHFAAFRSHIGLYPGAAAIEAFREELAAWRTARGTVQFPLDAPIPEALVERIVRFCVDQDGGVRPRGPGAHPHGSGRRPRGSPPSWPAVVTFDCYGTLVAWPETLRAVFETIVPPGTDAAQFHKDFGVWHVRMKDGPYRPYGDVLRAALAHTMAQWNLPDVTAAQARLMDAVRAIPPYPDVVPALQSLARHHRIAVLSNTEDALVAETVRGLQAPVELVTAERVRAYKPDPAFFMRAFERLGVSPHEVLHVAAGLATDMQPCHALGVTSVWIDRRGEPPDHAHPPTAVLSDLAQLERTIASLTPPLPAAHRPGDT
jgi:2-haloacid dehalogenase